MPRGQDAKMQSLTIPKIFSSLNVIYFVQYPFDRTEHVICGSALVGPVPKLVILDLSSGSLRVVGARLWSYSVEVETWMQEC